MKSSEKKDMKKEVFLVTTLFCLCGIALYQFSKINLTQDDKKPVKSMAIEKSDTYRSGIHEPLDKKLAFYEYEFDIAQGIEFHQPTGTHISIPKNAIVDKTGKPMNGKAKVKFREMHHAKDIFLSGIPMQTESNRNLFLESNGMMEMRVYQGENELALKEDEQIDIELAAMSIPTPDFKLWVLDQDRKWSNAGSFQTVTNERRDKQLNDLENEKKKRKTKKEAADNGLLKFIFNPNLKNFPHMAAWKDVKFELIKEDPNFPTENIARVDWTDIDMKKIPGTNQYAIKLTYSNFDYEGNQVNSICSIIAEPSDLSKKELKAIESDFSALSDQYAEFLKQASKEEERLKAEAAMLNKFKANGFGIYNVDKITDADKLAKMDMHFDFENELLLTKNPIQLLVISPDRNTVLNFLPQSWDKIPYLGPSTEFIASLPDGTYAYVDSKSFNSAVPQGSLSTTFQNKVSLKTKRLKKDEINNFF